MAKFIKVIVSNKELKILNDQKDLQNISKSVTFKIVKDIQRVTAIPTTVSFISAGSSKESFNNNTSLTVVSVQRHQQSPLLSANLPGTRENIEDVFPRAVKLFMVNYYFKPEYRHLSEKELLEIAKTIEINLTMDDIRFIEEITQDRKKNWYWQKLKAGRVTASKLKSVCEVSLSNPDKSLLTEICYPEKLPFPSETVLYKNRVKQRALSSFTSQMGKIHKNFKLKPVGLILDSNCPFFAASSDGLCSCTCCGEYFVEIKCPIVLSHKNASIEHLLQMENSFMEVVNGTYCLKRDHDYYYESQMQMALSKYKFSYFYIWSARFRMMNKIYFNSSFWTENSVRALKFAKEVLTIELMNSFYTKTY